MPLVEQERQIERCGLVLADAARRAATLQCAAAGKAGAAAADEADECVAPADLVCYIEQQ